MEDDKRQQNLNKYMNKITAAERFRDSGYKNLWLKLYKLYRNYVDPIIDPKTNKEDKKRSNISIPYTLVQVETILPRLVETLFASRPYVAVKGREPHDKNNAEIMETLLDWQMNERFDIKDIFATGLKILAIYGTTVGYTGWKLKEHTIIKKEMSAVLIKDKNGQMVPAKDSNGQPILDLQATKTNEVEYDDPEVKFIDLGLFYCDPHASDIEDARYCGHTTYETKEELQRLVDLDIGYKIDWKKVDDESNKQNEARNYRMSAVGLPTTDQTTSTEKDGLYEVHHYWEDDKHVVIINRCYVALETENPFWHKKKPYVKDVYLELPGEFYGMGIVEIIMNLQEELNTERNMRIDYRAMSLRRMFKAKKGADINPNDLVWRQNGIIWLDDFEDVDTFEINSKVGDSFDQEAQIKQDIRDATGAHDVVMGTSNTGETATTTMTKDNNASIRFKFNIASIEKKLLVGIARFMIQLNQQFIDDAKIFRLTGKHEDEYQKVTPEQIQGKFDLIPMGSNVEPLANKEAYKQRMIQLYQVAGMDPIMIQHPEKRINLLKQLFEAFGIKDTESLLPNESELNTNPKQAAQKVIEAKQELDQAQQSGDQQMIQEAQLKLDEAIKSYQQAQQQTQLPIQTQQAPQPSFNVPNNSAMQEGGLPMRGVTRG